MKRILSLTLIAGLGPAMVLAQEAEPGGVFFTFDLGQGLTANSDRDLATTDEESGIGSVTTLDFGAVTETRTQRLSFDLGTALRVTDGEFSDDGLSVGLAYSRNSADAQLDASVSQRRADIAFLRDASAFVTDDGEIVLPDDFDELTGTGVRAVTAANVSLTWGDTAPVGYRVSASYTGLRYEDASAPPADIDTAGVSIGLRLDINAVTTSEITLGYAQTDEEGLPVTDSTTLGGALTFARPLGDLTARVGASRDEMGDLFWSAAIERELVLSDRELSGALGVVQDAEGDAQLTGRIALRVPRPSGQIDFAAIHSLSAGASTATTTLRASYVQELSAISSMRIGFDFASVGETDSSDTLATGRLSASYGISLGEEWQLNIGVSTTIRDDDGSQTRNNAVFLTVERPFTWRL